MFTTGCNLKEDIRDYPYELVASGNTPVIPENFSIDLPRYYQNGIDCCVASGAMSIKSKKDGKRLSQRLAWAIAKEKQGYEGWGTYVHMVLDGMIDIGTTTEGVIDENVHMDREQFMRVPLTEELKKKAKPYRMESYWRVLPIASQVVSAIWNEQNGLLTTLPWYESYNHPVDGFLPLPKGNWSGHLITAKGRGFDSTGREYVVFQNTWGEDWGIGGDFKIYADEFSMRDIGGFYAIKDIPQDKAKILVTYNGKLIRNEGRAPHYFVAGGKIAWIKNEQSFYFGRDAKFWGDWKDTITIENDGLDFDLEKMFDLIF